MQKNYLIDFEDRNMSVENNQMALKIFQFELNRNFLVSEIFLFNMNYPGRQWTISLKEDASLPRNFLP